MEITCAEALRQAATELGRVVSSREIIGYIYRKYPDRPWKETTIRAHIIGCSVNHTSSHHYPSFPKFLYTVERGRVRLYNPKTDGKWVVDERGARRVEEGEQKGPVVVQGEEPPPDEATITLERDLETFLLSKLEAIEEGLKMYEGEIGRQFQVRSGRIDVLAQDKDNNFVVLELKAGTATEPVLTQLLAYMAEVKEMLSKDRAARGIIVAYDFAERLVAATSLLPMVKLVKYKVRFDFEVVTRP